MESSPNFGIQHSFPPIDPDIKDMRALAAAVICQTVQDWQSLMHGATPTADCNYSEIRYFLTDGLGADLCSLIGLDSDVVLSKLENELKHYRINGAIPIKHRLRHNYMNTHDN